MTKQMQRQEGVKRSSEQGNVLFLILIAVALFAALSYAVTQSTRSGGGDANKETTLVNSSTITQYPASVKTAIVRMIVSNGVTVDQLIFNPPSEFSTLTGNEPAQDVFHPTGGGANYSLSPANVMADNVSVAWRYNAANQVYNIGQDGAPGGDNYIAQDLIALLPNVSRSICERIHTQLGLGTIPTETGIILTNTKVKATPAIPAYSAAAVIGDSGGSVLNGQPQGCFIQSTVYYYYHVLVER